MEAPRAGTLIIQSHKSDEIFPPRGEIRLSAIQQNSPNKSSQWLCIGEGMVGYYRVAAINQEFFSSFF